MMVTGLPSIRRVVTLSAIGVGLVASSSPSWSYVYEYSILSPKTLSFLLRPLYWVAYRLMAPRLSADEPAHANGSSAPEAMLWRKGLGTCFDRTGYKFRLFRGLGLGRRA